MAKSTDKQISYLHDLCDEAGYAGDRKYNAGRDLLDDGSAWRTAKGASELIDALLAKLGRATKQPQARTAQHRVYDDGQPIVHPMANGRSWVEY